MLFKSLWNVAPQSVILKPNEALNNVQCQIRQAFPRSAQMAHDRNKGKIENQKGRQEKKHFENVEWFQWNSMTRDASSKNIKMTFSQHSTAQCLIGVTKVLRMLGCQ
jgi:hypothetical protein